MVLDPGNRPNASQQRRTPKQRLFFYLILNIVIMKKRKQGILSPKFARGYNNIPQQAKARNRPTGGSDRGNNQNTNDTDPTTGITQQMIEALKDTITDYPLCAIESDVADMDCVNDNVNQLNALLHSLEIIIKTSPICK